jgi:hypothetical protein
MMIDFMSLRGTGRLMIESGLSPNGLTNGLTSGDGQGHRNQQGSQTGDACEQRGAAHRKKIVHTRIAILRR